MALLAVGRVSGVARRGSGDLHLGRGAATGAKILLAISLPRKDFTARNQRARVFVCAIVGKIVRAVPDSARQEIPCFFGPTPSKKRLRLSDRGVSKIEAGEHGAGVGGP